VPVAGIWVRQTRPGVGAGQPVTYDARWQRAGTPAAYFGDSESTVWAELYRGLAERGIPPADVFPRDLHRVHVDLARVVDLSRERSRRALGLARMSQTQKQWPAFQPIGERLAAEGADGILYASSARTRAACLCVFDAGLSSLRAVGEPVRVIAAPPLPRGLRT
jgi:RES domain-containing protein